MKNRVVISLITLAMAVSIIYCNVSETIYFDREYYFSEKKLYVKICNPLFNQYGYVFFSKDSIVSSLEKTDYIKIYKSDISDIRCIFDTVENNNIYIVDRFNNAEINQVDYNFKRINWTDSLFVEQKIIDMTNRYTIKSSYWEIIIDGYNQSLFFSGYPDSVTVPADMQSVEH